MLEGRVLAALAAGSSSAQLLALEVVSGRGTPQRVAAVVPLARGGTEAVRREATVVLKTYRSDPEVVRERNRILVSLSEAARDPSRDVRLHALAGLSGETSPSPALIESVQQIAKTDDDASVQALASQILLRWNDRP